MPPRPGGEADKVGNRYESAWVVRHVLYVLDGRADSIVVEDRGLIADGVEFTYVANGVTQVHQVKRQHGTANSWSASALRDVGIWGAAREHAANGREFHFASTVPARPIQELADFAQRSSDYPDFIQNWLPNDDVRRVFSQLSGSDMLGGPELAWRVLRSFWFHVQEEVELSTINAAYAEHVLDGAPGSLSTPGLADIVVNHLGVPLTLTSLLPMLSERGLALATPGRVSDSAQSIGRVTDHWITSVESQQLSPEIPRTEAANLISAIEVANGLTFVTGSAGDGKTGVALQSVKLALKSGYLVLAFRLDRLEPYQTTAQLAERVGLESRSPVVALADASAGAPAILVIDQLDAVSFVSGRMPANFDVVADLFRESLAFPNIQLVLVCREFDVANDERFRALMARHESTTMRVHGLSDDDVDSAVSGLGADPSLLTAQQHSLLHSPLHLVLFAGLVGDGGERNWDTTLQLQDAYWDRKRRDARARRSGLRFNDVVEKLANAISERQRLSVPAYVLDEADLLDDADVLISEHLVVKDREELAFFHESFFDYAFARSWLRRGETLEQFLLAGEQELFRRGQVRQVLALMRAREPARFLTEMKALLGSHGVRTHIKDVACAVLGAILDPRSEEAQLVIAAAGADSIIDSLIWRHVRTPAWAQTFDDHGYISKWLSADVHQTRGLQLLGELTSRKPKRVVEILEGNRDQPGFGSWVRWLAQRMDLASNRRMFELFLEGVSQDELANASHGAWWPLRALPEKSASWSLEVVQKLFGDLSKAELGADMRLKFLGRSDHVSEQFLVSIAKADARAFIERVLPLILEVARITAYPGSLDYLPIADAQFCGWFGRLSPSGNLGDTVLDAMGDAIEHEFKFSSKASLGLLQTLRENDYLCAQWLLYRGIRAAPDRFASLAVHVFLERPSRLFPGYSSEFDWDARETVKAIAPYLDDSTFALLESAIVNVHVSDRNRKPGYQAFTLIACLPRDRLSPLGVRRLNEFRRKFGAEEPRKRLDIISGSLGSPISPDAGARMSDRSWLRAMDAYPEEREDFSNFTGGARELSSVLEERVKEEPLRFARLALKIRPSHSSSYSDAILRGLGNAPLQEETSAIYAAAEHFVSIGHTSADRWLSWALRPYVKELPVSMLEMVRDRAVSSPDPEGDGVRMWHHDKSGQQIPEYWSSAINGARGSLALFLSDLLVLDSDGSRTAVVVDALGPLASDSAIPVRMGAARLVHAAYRYAESQADIAFKLLFDSSDHIFDAPTVEALIANKGWREPTTVVSLIERMCSSDLASARKMGGRLAALAGMEWGGQELFTRALASSSVDVRAGFAEMCAHRLKHATDTEIAANALEQLFNDPAEDVRRKAAEVAGALRDDALESFAGLLSTLISSQAYVDALSQLVITLEHATDRVDSLVTECAKRFVADFGDESSDIRTGVAGDASQIAELLLRALAQTDDRTSRSQLLDVLDGLIAVNAYGVQQLVDTAER